MAPAIQNKYIWALDSDSNLVLANPVPPYTFSYMAYVSTTTAGSVWPQVAIKATVISMVNNGAGVALIKGCIDPVTGELTLNAGGRENILWCGAQMWMSYGNGEDINRGGCTRMYPTVPVVPA